MDLNVLVEAKKEYLGQLCKLMCPVMIAAFYQMYEEASKISKGRKVLLQYQKLLKEVPNWNDHIVKQNTDEASRTCGWFSDLLAAVFVSFVKILSSVRLKTDNKKISIKLPTNELFVHTCFINAAKDLYRDPYIYEEEQNEHARETNLTHRFSICIEATIKELRPIQQILETYMKQSTGAQSVDLNMEEAVEDTEDPDIDENEPGPDPEQGPEPGPEPGPGQGPEPTGEPVPGQEPGAAAGPEPAPLDNSEIKQIPVRNVPGGDDDDVLFPNAPQETKVA
jgi:hypothetical protein